MDPHHEAAVAFATQLMTQPNAITETPTQIAIFVATTQATGKAGGLLV